MEKIKFVFTVRTNKVGSETKEIIEFDTDEFEGMTDDQKEEYLADAWQEWANQNISGGWEETE